MEIAVIGSGSWATALVKLISTNNGANLHWVMRRQEDVDFVKLHKHNPGYLSGLQLDINLVNPNTDLKNSISSSDILFLATPAAFLQASLKEISASELQNKTVVSAIKGVVPKVNLLVTDWLEQHYGLDSQSLAVIAGPCHAEEVALERQSYLTIAAHNEQVAQSVANLLACSYIKTGLNTDLYGVEYCAIMKNIVAIGCGICHGYGMGDNFQAVLVSVAMQEIQFFLDTLFPLNTRNLLLSAYLGDLLVTCYSQFSRNRTFGNMLGRGYSVASAQMEMNMISEGYFAVECLNDRYPYVLSQMPIIYAVYQILYQHADLSTQVKYLRQYLS